MRGEADFSPNRPSLLRWPVPYEFASSVASPYNVQDCYGNSLEFHCLGASEGFPGLLLQILVSRLPLLLTPQFSSKEEKSAYELFFFTNFAVSSVHSDVHSFLKIPSVGHEFPTTRPWSMTLALPLILTWISNVHSIPLCVAIEDWSHTHVLNSDNPYTYAAIDLYSDLGFIGQQWKRKCRRQV